MLYLSKGIVCKNSTCDCLNIARGESVVTISGKEAGIWLEGRLKINSDLNDIKTFEILSNKGLIEYEESSDALGKYRILTRCICCPTKVSILKKPLSKTEKTVLEWLTRAGLRLSTAELIFLMENNVLPSPSLLYEENRQALVETIYTRNNIFDNILETQMEKAHCRDKIVNVLLKLLYKRRIVVL